MAMSLRLPDEVATELREVSEKEGMSMNTAVVIAISEWLERKKTDHVLKIADRIMDRHADLLQRLAKS